MDRRDFVTTTALGGALALVACSSFDPTQITTFVTKLLASVAQVQQGVRDKLKAVCTAATSLVPTVDTIMTLFEALLGTALGPNNIATLTATIVQKAIDTVVAAGCPPSPSTTPATAMAYSATVNGKSIPIVFV